jgi:hypothetical protein
MVSFDYGNDNEQFITGNKRTDNWADALAGLGHACGHNLIGVSSVGAALATADVVMERRLGGKVVLFGTPAEGNSRWKHMTDWNRSTKTSHGRGRRRQDSTTGCWSLY